jgi:hypothetical protein
MTRSKVVFGFVAAYGQTPQLWQKRARALVITPYSFALSFDAFVLVFRSSFHGASRNRSRCASR